jgi:hypothetical protein
MKSTGIVSSRDHLEVQELESPKILGRGVINP